MKCPNCGAEIGEKRTCEFCGTQITTEMLREQEQLNKQGCPKCGSTNVAFTRENQGEIKGEKTKRIIHRTVGVCKDCGHTWVTDQEGTGGIVEPKKRRTWLWVLGWIFIFPVPLTILMLRNKDMKPALKYGIIAAGWIVFLAIGLSGRGGEENTAVPSTSVVTAEEPEPQQVAVDTETKEEHAEAEYEFSIEPNVNADDGTVLFGVKTNMPEDSKITVELSNDNGYKAEDTATVLGNSYGYTAEFDENGAGLKGVYTVRLFDASGNMLKEQEFTFDDMP